MGSNSVRSCSQSFLLFAYLAINTSTDFDQLCALEGLGLPDTAAGDQGDVYAEFKEQLMRAPEGWYETALPWKVNHPELPNNRDESIHRSNLLTQSNILQDYDAIIQYQLPCGIVEVAPEHANQKEFYIPHRPIVKETSKTTKLCIVYDASAHAQPDAKIKGKIPFNFKSLLRSKQTTNSLD